MTEFQKDQRQAGGGAESDLSEVSAPARFSRLTSPVVIGAAIGLAICHFGGMALKHFGREGSEPTGEGGGPAQPALTASNNWGLTSGTVTILGDRTNFGPYTVPFTAPPLRYEVSKSPPYRIHDPILDDLNRQYTNGPTIAIIDTAAEGVMQKSGTNALVSSHYECIRSLISGKGYRTVAFDASQEGSDRVSWAKIREVLDHIEQTSESNGIGVVNCSFGSIVSFETINQLRAIHSAEEIRSSPPFSSENLAARASEVRSIVNEFGNNPDPRIDPEFFKNLQFVRATIPIYDRLTAKGIAVLKCAGNDGADKFDLVSAAVGDIIVVAGADATSSRFDKRSSATSLVDITLLYEVPIQYGTWTVKIQGSSYSTAEASLEVASLKEGGLSVREINDSLRADQKQWEQENKIR